MVDEGSGAAGTQRGDDLFVPQAIGEQQHVALECRRVHRERERAGQHLHEQLGTAIAGRFAGDEHAALAHRPHFALDPIQGPQRVGESEAELGHNGNIARGPPPRARGTSHFAGRRVARARVMGITRGIQRFPDY